MAEETVPPNDNFTIESLQEQARRDIATMQQSMHSPAKPDSIDAYKNVVGNPLTGSNPAIRNSSDPSLALIQSFGKNVNSAQGAASNPFASMRPYTYSGDTDTADFERYQSSGDAYDKLGYSPYRDNESLYNNKMTFGDQFVRAAGQWDNLVGTGFMSGLKSWGTIFTDPLAPDIQGAREMSRAMKIGSSNTGGIGAFFTNTFLNSGYTVGIGVDFLAEELALMGLTAATGGATGEAVVGKGLQAINNIFRGSKTAIEGAETLKEIRDVAGNINKSRQFWNSIPGKVIRETADILNPLDQTLDAVKGIAKAAKIEGYAMDYAKVSKTFGAFADDLLMMKGAVSEAKLEGGMVKIDISKDLIDEYRANYGVDPVGEELTKIEKIASDEAHRVAFWNLPAITTSNKLMYATMLAPMRGLMGRAGSVRLVDDYIFKKGKGFVAVGDDIASKAGAAASSLASGKFYKGFGMNYLKANFAEGIQENLQEAISSGAAAHAKALYKDPIRASYENYMPYFMHGLNEQLSAQGAETFAGGFAMGMFAQPIMAIPSVSISKLIKAVDGKDYGKLKAERMAEKEAKAKVLNELYNNSLLYLGSDIGHATVTGNLANDVYSAARAGNKKEAIDALDNMTNNHIITALQTGKLDIIIDKMKQYENFSAAETKEAFEKYGIKTDEDVQKASGKIKGIIERAKALKEHYEDVVEKYPNPYVLKNVNLPIKYIEDLKTLQIASHAWDKAVQNLVFAKATFDTTSARVAEVANIFSQISTEFAKGDAQAMFSMLNPSVTKNEITQLKKDIKSLDDTIPEAAKLKKEKTKQLEKLSNYYEAMKVTRTDTSPEAMEKAKEAFGDYVGYLSKKNDHIVFTEALDNAFTIVKDHMSMKNDMQGLAQSINVLMAPKNFFKLHQRLEETYTAIVDEMPETIDENEKASQALLDHNKVLQEISGSSVLGLQVPTEVSDAFHTAHEEGTEYPKLEYLIDKNGNKVTSGPEFDIAVDIWNKYIRVITEAKPKAPVEEEEISAEDIAYQKANVDFIKNKIKTLKEKSALLNKDADTIKDTLAFLVDKLDNSVDLAQEDLRRISNQLDVMLSPIKSSLLYKTNRGKKTASQLRQEYRKEIQVLNDVTDRIKDLKEDLAFIESNSADLKRQADYYANLLRDPAFTMFDAEELQAKHAKIVAKVNTIENLIDGIKAAIAKSIDYIRDYVNNIFKAEDTIRKFSDLNNYRELSTPEINELMNSELEDDKVFLDSYPALKERFGVLETDLLSNLDSLEFSEEVMASEQERKAQLEASLQKYQNQLRYLEELFTVYKEVDLTQKANTKDLEAKAKQLGISVEELKSFRAAVVDDQPDVQEADAEEKARLEASITGLEADAEKIAVDIMTFQVTPEDVKKAKADEKKLIEDIVDTFQPESRFTDDIDWMIDSDTNKIIITIDGSNYTREDILNDYELPTSMPRTDVLAEMKRLQTALDFEIGAVKQKTEVILNTAGPTLETVKVNLNTLSIAQLKDLKGQIEEKADVEQHKADKGKAPVENVKTLNQDAKVVGKIITVKEAETDLKADTEKNKIESTDKIIWGHPTIGKSYLKKKGDDRFITLDDDYKDEINTFIDANRGSESRQEYKGRKPKEYNDFMVNLYEKIKVIAEKEGKKLFVSNTHILNTKMGDFDKVINISKKEFEKRLKSPDRNSFNNYHFDDWKSEIDTVIAKVDNSKVINTTGYLSDLLERNFATMDELLTAKEAELKEKVGDALAEDKKAVFDEVTAKYDELIKNFKETAPVTKKDKVADKKAEEEGKVVHTFTFVLPTVTEKIATINSDLNLQSLKMAKANNFEIIYNNKNYIIDKINKNSVTLVDSLNVKTDVAEENFSDLLVVEPGINEASPEEVEMISKNQETVSTPKDFTEPTAKLTEEEYKSILLKNLC